MTKKWQISKEILHWSDRDEKRTDAENQTLCCTFSEFVQSKITYIKAAIHTRLLLLNSQIPQPDAPFTGSPMSSFVPCTSAEVAKLLSFSSSISSRQDFTASFLVKSCSSIFSVLISTFANLSMYQYCFPNSFKITQVSPLLKIIGLDKDNPSNY